MKNKLFKLCLFLILFSNQMLIANELSLEYELSKKYISEKLEEKFPGEIIDFDIQNNQITIHGSKNEEIQSYLESIVDQAKANINDSNKCYYPYSTVSSAPIEEGEWLPELNPFFPTLLAEPHIIGYSVGYRSYDKVFKIDCLPVSIGDQFSLCQFKNICRGNLYFGIEACVWAIFEAKTNSLALINADYYVALPLTYIYNDFAARLRVYHQSSHLGDEILIENHNITRLNPSMEVVDLFLSYNFLDTLTLFGGFSRVLRSDDSYKIKPNGFYYGFNCYLNMFKTQHNNLKAIPYIATYFDNLQENRWKTNFSVAIGYQLDKLYGHKLRIYVEGHEGYSAEGQFSKKKTRYVALKLTYGY